jgi:hypothetical protein
MQSGGKLLQFPIDANLDQSIEQSSGAQPGALSELINLRKDRTGRLVKRNGYATAGSSGGQIPVRLLTNGSSVALADKSAVIRAYGEGTSTWTSLDRTPRWCLTGARFLTQLPYMLTLAGCCSASGATFHIYIDENVHDVKCIVTDEVSGDVIRGPHTVIAINGGLGETAIPLARIVTDGTRLWVFYQVSKATPAIRVKPTTVANIISGGAWPATVDLGAMDGTNPSFDVTVTTSFAYAAFNFDNAGTKRLKVIRVDSAGTITHTYQFDVGCRAVSCLFAGSIVWVLYALTSGGGINTDVRALDSTLSLLATNAGPGSAAGAVDTTCIGFFDSDSVILVAAANSTIHNPRGHLALARADYAASAITYTDAGLLLGCYPASQPFRTGTGGDGSDVFMWVDCSFKSADPYAFTALIALTHDGGSLYSVSPSFVAAEFPHLRVQAGRTSMPYQWSFGYTVPQKVYASSQDSSVYVWDNGFRIPPEIPSAIKEYRFQRADPYINAAMVSCEAHGLTIATGGCLPFAYDGQHFTELGFCYPPNASSDYVTTSGAGGSIAAGSYQWAVTYEYTDGAGLRHQSAPITSIVKTTTGATSKADLAVPTLKMTTKQDREFSDGSLRIVVWRSLSTDAATFYRVTSAINNPEVATVTVTDTYADATIAVNEILYTIRGELTNEMAPCMWHAVPFAGKLAFIDAEYRNRIGFSKPFASERGIECSSASQTLVDGIGDLTALAEMDGNLYAFSATGVAWAASGSGIDAAGQGSWPEPQILSRAAGCIDGRALCVSQDGVIFVSRQGSAGILRVWLLPRGGGNPVEIGKKVRKYLGNQSWLTTSGFLSGTLSVMSCVNWVDQGRVSITLRGTSASFRLEYDYINRDADGIGTWGADYGTGLDAAGGVASTTVARGALWLAATSPGVLRSSETGYLDESATYIPFRIRTHDIKLSLIPFAKLNQLTATLETNAANSGGVKFELSVDAAQTFPFTTTFTFASITASAQVQRQWQPPTRRSATGHGYALQLSSIAPGGGNDNTADVIPRAVAIDYMPLPGTHRPMASERV